MNNKIVLVKIVSILFTLVLLLVACSQKREHSNPLDPLYNGPITYVISSKVINIDSKTNLALIDSSNGIFKFSYTGPKPDISTGNILVGSEGYGYLRYVTSIKSSSSNQIIVETRQASLTEAVSLGSIDTTMILTPGGSNYRLLKALSGVKVQDSFIDLSNVILYSGKIDIQIL